MKIALLTPTFSQFSGIDRVVELDAEKYAKQGHKVLIMTFKAEIKPKNKNISVKEIGMPSSQFIERIYRLFFFLNFVKIDKCAEMLKDCDLIVSYFYPMNCIASHAKKRYNIKYKYWNAGVAFPWLFKNPLENIYMHLFNLFSNASAKDADSAVSISKFLQKQLKEETGVDSKVEYIEIDKKRFHKGISGQRIRKKYNLGKSPACLYVGRISPHKGVDLLIKAFNLVIEEIPDAKLIIAGKPTFDSYFKELKEISNKNIIFAGFVKDEELPEYYSACDVYTTASLWEGFDMPIAEAYACGKPSVAFNVCSHPEVLKKGILVKENDVEGFAKAVVKLIKKRWLFDI